MGLGPALKKVTMKGCLERGACRPSRPARPGSTLRPETEEGEMVVTHGWRPCTWTLQCSLCRALGGPRSMGGKGWRGPTVLGVLRSPEPRFSCGPSRQV